MLARLVLIVALFVMAGAGIVWYRGHTNIMPSPAAEAQRIDTISMNRIYPGGGAPPPPPANTRYEASGYDVSHGKELYHAYNCNGCHANGGGGIGPALMDDRWLYGSEPANIFQTIVEGRPNGMPSFRNKIPDDQIWQIVAYVRSLSGLDPSSAVPARTDQMNATPPPPLQDAPIPVTGGLPQ